MSALGCIVRNLDTWFLVKRSASVLCDPGMCAAFSWSWKWTLTKKRVRSICARWGSLLWHMFKITTTALLSHWVVTLCPLHFRPYRKSATMIRTGSFMAIWRCCDQSSHWSSNHSTPHQAPQPHEPDASDVSTISLTCEPGIKERHSSVWQKFSTMAIKSLLSFIWWCGSSTVWTSEIIRRTNAFPAGITVDTWCIVPRSDSNSCLVQDGQRLSCRCLQIWWLHFSVRYCKRSSLSAGRHSSCWDVSIIIPRNSIVVLGPACFSGANGMPSSLQIALRIPKLW